MKKKRSAYRRSMKWIIGCMLFLVGCAYLLIAYVKEEYGPYKLSHFERSIGASLPKDAKDIIFMSDIVKNFWLGTYGGYINLRFKASPKNSIEFLKVFCGGMRYVGYDPFSSVRTEASDTEALLIKAYDFAYYSSSPDAPDTIQGNTCLNTYGHAQRISVDTSNPALYSIHYELLGVVCNESPLPCSSTSMATNYVEPFPDLPLIIIGLESNEEKIFLDHKEICFETRGDYFSGWGEAAVQQDLIGADVQLTLDGAAFPLGTIDYLHRLVRKADMKSIDMHEAGLLYWNYCVKQIWDVGLHEVTVQITVIDGEALYYTFMFEVQPFPDQ